MLSFETLGKRTLLSSVSPDTSYQDSPTVGALSCPALVILTPQASNRVGDMLLRHAVA
jgi:hypothetical protein